MRKTISALVVMSFVALLYAFAAPAQNSDWKQLFNGKDLTGWKHVGPGGMTVEDGLIKTHGGMGLLYWTGGKVGIVASRLFIACVTITTIPACSFVFPS